MDNIPFGGPILCRQNRWYLDFFPKDESGDASPIFAAMNDEEYSYFCDCMRQGGELVHQFWSEAWQEFCENIFIIMPRKPKGLFPHNASVHAFRGLITSNARPSYLAAQTLAHEGGHNKLSSVLDVFISISST